MSGAVAVVRNTLPSHTIGDDQPIPGISATHSTFSVVDQVFGNRGWSLTGSEPGPRNCGQLTGEVSLLPPASASVGAAAAQTSQQNSAVAIMRATVTVALGRCPAKCSLVFISSSVWLSSP